ncbi:hypothetical protein [Paenibacillus sp. PL2-23]|uniref:hypothetical protein n=1 Tax=Paenibacillus sp. PL2-23 TaxID=2100729 RepID=UPI0030FA346D
MKQTVYYTRDADTGALYPEWLLLTEMEGADWTRPLFIRLDAPFEAYESDEQHDHELTLSVPDFVYLRHLADPALLGLHLPSLRQYVDRIASTSGMPFSHLSLSKLLLRFSDIEEALQYEVRARYPWSRRLE